MSFSINTSEPIAEHSLAAFYTYAVLPQFGIKDTDITWQDFKELTLDEVATFSFRTAQDKFYVLLFYADNNDLRTDDHHVLRHFIAEGQEYEYVLPISDTAASPSYGGFNVSSSSKYSTYITGNYTLYHINSDDHDGYELQYRSSDASVAVSNTGHAPNVP